MTPIRVFIISAKKVYFHLSHDYIHHFGLIRKPKELPTYLIPLHLSQQAKNKFRSFVISRLS